MLSIFIPVYNEESIVKTNLIKVYDSLKTLGYPFEIFMIDDGSTDQSNKSCLDLEKKYPEMNYLYYPNGPTRRENLADSFYRANYKVLIFMDLDLSTNLRYLKTMVQYILDGYDIAIGSRYLGIKPHRSTFRKSISQIYNLFMKIYFKSNIEDHQCGFKAFKKRIIFDLLNKAGYDRSKTRGWFWDAEILIRAQKKGYTVKEFPVSWKSGKKSSFTLKKELKMLYFLIQYGPKIRRNEKLFKD
ncbi:MAG: glycosyltransferase [Candidatus Woesearchaeota archaeon]